DDDGTVGEGLFNRHGGGSLARGPGLLHREAHGGLEDVFEIERAAVGGVDRENALPGGAGYTGKLFAGHLERFHDVSGGSGHQDLAGGLEEVVKAVPLVADERDAAGGGLEQPARRAVAHLRRGGASHAQGQAGRAVKGRVVPRRNVGTEVDVVGPRKLGRVLRAGDEEPQVGAAAGGLDEEIL